MGWGMRLRAILEVSDTAFDNKEYEDHTTHLRQTLGRIRFLNKEYHSIEAKIVDIKLEFAAEFMREYNVDIINVLHPLATPADYIFKTPEGIKYKAKVEKFNNRLHEIDRLKAVIRTERSVLR